jgi:predicted lactoylglutathione lyase
MNRINVICLGVKNLAKSLAFYKDIGFKTEEKKDSAVVFFDTQGTKLELCPLTMLIEDIDAKNPPALSAGGFTGVTLAINMKSEQEVDAYMKKVSTAGGTIAKQPQKVSWGGYSGYFRDADGHYWEVAYNPFWKFDKNDMLVF